MFKKLRNKFLVLNVAIITVLQLAAFIGIYIFTFSKTEHSISNRLNRAMAGDESIKARESLDNSENKRDDPNLKIVFPPDRPEHMSLIFVIKTDGEGNVIEIKSPFDIGADICTRLAQDAIKSDGETMTFKASDSVWAYKTKINDIGGYNIYVTDISREKNMLANLVITFIYVGALALFIIFLISLFFANRAIKPISEVWEKQKRFIEDASHELKTPLTIINTNADVLLAHPNSTINEEKKWIYYIKDETQRMTGLTNNLLFLARMDNGNDYIKKQNFSLSETVETALLTMEAVFYEKNLRLESDIAKNITVFGDCDSIKQLVMILMDNASKYTENGGLVSVTLSKKDERAVLSVSNTGAPLPQTEWKHIFDRFYRADKSRTRSSGGYGLGLAIARSICRNHGGQISGESKDGKNIFTVVL